MKYIKSQGKGGEKTGKKGTLRKGAGPIRIPTVKTLNK